MSALRQLQADFLSWLTRGDAGVQRAVTGTPRVSRETRLDIYRDAYRLRLQEALGDSYPALHTLLGDTRFEDLGRAYIETCPSRHFSIRFFGHRLSRFLADTPPYREQPVLAEMAAFEWALRAAFDAGDRPPVDLASLRQVPPEAWANLRLELHPTLRRLDLEWNVPQLWQAIDADAEPLSPRQNPYPLGWLIWRRELRTYYRSLETDEAWALDAVALGQDFAAICSGLCEWIDEAHTPMRAAGMVQGWVEEGLIAGLHSA